MKPASATLVIARYQEDLEWITGVPEHFRIIIYNKGPLIESLSALQRADVIETRDNVGRESETIVHHVMKHREEPNEWTVFCQGDPFEHSPDFLNLLKEQELWSDIQSLSCQWIEDQEIPPKDLLARQTGDQLAGLRVRREVFSLRLWSSIWFADPGSLSHREEYSKLHDLPNGGNMAAHFLRMADLPELAAQAEEADFGRFCYGAIFAVRSRLLVRINPDSCRKLLTLSKGHSVHGYVFERLWLHLFGEPFLTLAAG